MTGGGPRASDRLRWLLPVGVVALSFVIVMGAYVPAPHSGGDNATYLTLGHSLATRGSYTELFDPAGQPHTKYPPVFPTLLAALMLLGARTWTVFKSVAVVSTLAAVALTYLWAARRLGRAWAAGVAVILASSSAVVYYSHWILSDPTFVALTLLALVALERATEEDAGTGWLALGALAAGLAYFTRSAGLPLVMALWVWLGLRRRWRALAATAVALGVPMVLWMLRARGAGQGEYVAEFWLVDPYQPALGRVGLGGLARRFGENLVGYVGRHLPAGVVGTESDIVPVLGVTLVVVAAIGWGLEVRRRVGPAELFLPLYAGLILLWPVVWSGDRFALPLYAPLFVYGALALRGGAARFGRAAVTAVGLVAFLIVFLAAAGGWPGAVVNAAGCRALVRRDGPFGCSGSGMAAFVEASAWARANLPEGSAVLTRKPSMFYVLSGVPSRTFPFSREADDHLAVGDELGARYELLDELDALANAYVVPAVYQRPGAFCLMRRFGPRGTTQLLGMLPPESRARPAASPEGEVRVVLCPASYGPAESALTYSMSSRIPLLDEASP